MFSYTERKGLLIAPAILSSLIMAIAGMGDALLYAYLPVEGKALGISAVLVGVLLSLNKFVRFFFNRWVAKTAAVLGNKTILLSGVCLATIITFTYAINPPAWVWIISRILWGLSFSAMRFSCYQYSALSATTGSALGLGKSMQEAGPVFIYLAGPLLIGIIGAPFTFITLSFLTGIMIFLFPFLPENKTERQSVGSFKFRSPGPADTWAFVTSFITDGIFVVGIIHILDIDAGSYRLATAAIYISLRRGLNIILSPVAGWLSDRYKLQRVFNFSSMLLITGVLIAATNFPATGIIISFLAAAINHTILPVFAIKHKKEAERTDRLTTMTTCRDLGSASGALLGLPILASFQTSIAIGTIALLLFIVWFNMRKFVNSHE